MKKTSLSLLLLAVCLTGGLLTGCAHTYGLSDEQVEDAYVKYAGWYVIDKDDSALHTTAKVVGRGLIDVVTLGIFESKVVRNKSRSCHFYYLDTFVGKTKHDVILEFGVPDRSFSDGNGGEVFVYSFTWVSGNRDNVYTKREETTFYIDKSGVVYKNRWSLQ